MAPKTIKKKSSAKRESPRRVRSAATTPRRRAVSSPEEELFAKAFRSSPHPVGITELETGRCLDVNDACLEIFGFRRDEVVGHTTLMLGIWPDLKERVRLIERLKSEGTVRNLDVSMRIKDGELCQFIISTDLITLRGKPCLLTIGNDITERKRAEEALRESEQRFRAIYDQTYEFIGLLTSDGTLINVNQTALAFRGLQRSDVVGKPFWETPWWDLSHELQAKLKVAIAEAATGEFVRLRAQHRSLDGTIEEVDFSLTPITDRSGKVTQIIPEGRRITMLTRAQDQLRQAYEGLEQRVVERTAELMRSNESLQMEIAERKQVEAAVSLKSQLINLSFEPIFVRTIGSEIIEWNHGCQCLYGYSSTEAVGRVSHMLLKTEFPLPRANIEAQLLVEGSWTGELRHRTRDGREVIVESCWQLIATDEHHIVLEANRDITKRKQAEEALQQRQHELRQSQRQLQDLTEKLFMAQDRERQRIARDLHDDFSQRIGALVLDVASLQRQPPLSPELIEQALEPVREELTQLTKDLHSLAYRLDPPLLRHAGLRAAIEDAIHKAIERTGLQITLTATDLPHAIPLEWSICLFRVFQESLQNVAKHATATDVVVTLSGSSKGIGLSVADNGKGFDARDKDGHQKGLGLTSMRERLRLVKGFLNIHSRLADGTKVCAWIPFQEKAS